MKGPFTITILLAALLTGCSTDKTPQQTIVFQKGENGFDTYRIPAITIAADGTLLAFAEARRNSGSDTGDIDMVVKRSEDGGRTWSEMATVWDDGDNVCGNPSPVVDQESGRIVLALTWNKGSDHENEILARTSSDTRKVFLTVSDDNGRTWSLPEDITSQTKDQEWTWYATGPCHGIQLQSGRIVVPCNHGIFKDGQPAGYESHVIYSDDIGETWHIGGIVKGFSNESTVAVTGDGSLMINMRTGGDDREANGFARKVALSHDQGLSFDEAYYDPGLQEPVCQASLISYSCRKDRFLLFSNPDNASNRVNLTLKLSRDDGGSWEKVLTLAEGPSAYSDICVFPNGDVGVLYETGKDSPYETITFARVSRRTVHSTGKK